MESTLEKSERDLSLPESSDIIFVRNISLSDHEGTLRNKLQHVNS